jgi:hypothetical protein
MEKIDAPPEDWQKSLTDRHATAVKNCSRFQVQCSRVKFKSAENEENRGSSLPFVSIQKSRAVTDPVERLERSEAMEPFDRLRAGYGTIGTTR